MLHQPTLDKLQELKLVGMLRAYQSAEAKRSLTESLDSILRRDKETRPETEKSRNREVRTS